MRGSALASALLLVGCKVVDAPEDLEDLAVFGFVHFEDGDDFREETANAMNAAMDENLEALREGYRVDSLSLEDLEAAGVEAATPRELVGIAVMIEMQSAVQDIVEVLCGDDLADLFSSTLEYTVHDSTDVDCFLAHECESYQFDGTRQNDLGLMGTSTQDFEMTLRWVEMDDGRTGVLIRQLAPDEVDLSSPLLRMHQNFIFDFLEPTPDGGGTRRFEANWIDVELIGLDLPDSIALDLAVNSLQNRGVEMDEVLGAGDAP